MASASGSGIITPANASENEGPSTPPSFAQSLGKQIVSGLARLSGWGRKRVRRVQFQPLAEVHEFERYPCGGGGVPDADQIALGLGPRCVGHSSAPLVDRSNKDEYGSIGHLEADDRLALLKQWAPARGGARAFEKQIEEEVVPELTRLQAERDRCANSTRDQRSMPTSEAEAVRIASRDAAVARELASSPKKRNSVRGAVAALVAGAAGRSARIRRAMAGQSAAEAAAAAAAPISSPREHLRRSSGITKETTKDPFAFPAGSPSPRAKPAPPSGKRKAAKGSPSKAKGSPSKAKGSPSKAKAASPKLKGKSKGSPSPSPSPRKAKGKKRWRDAARERHAAVAVPPMVASPSPRKSPPKRGRP